MVESKPSEIFETFLAEVAADLLSNIKRKYSIFFKTSIAHICTCSFITELNITEMFCCHQMPKMGIEVIICMHFRLHTAARKLVAQESDSL